MPHVGKLMDAEMVIEEQVASHYTHGGLETAILAGLQAMGRDRDQIQADDLAAMKRASENGSSRALPTWNSASSLSPTSSVSRVATATYSGVRSTPITRQPYSRAKKRAGGATLLHVGMNIPDKERLCREVYRVLKSGGLFAIYDVMRTGDEEIEFPVPWAATPSTSFLQTPEHYRQALTHAGFEIKSERNRRDVGIEFFKAMRARIAESGPPPLGLHILMGQDAPIKTGNMLRNLEEARIAPVEMIAMK